MERIKVRLYFFRLWGRNIDLSLIKYTTFGLAIWSRRYRQRSWFYRPERLAISIRLFKWEVVIDYKRDL